MPRTDPDKLIIEIDEQGTTITEVRGNSQSTKTINPDDLKYLFSETAFDTGMMPCSDTGVVFVGRQGDTEAVLYQSGPRKVDIRWGYTGEIIKQVPFPHLIFAFQLGAPKAAGRGGRQPNRYRDSKVFALQHGVKFDTDTLYNFTGYGNTYSGGAICWGSNRIEATDIASCRGVVNAFYSTPFNGHLGGTDGFISTCVRNGTFPLEGKQLNKTIKDLIRETFSGQTY